MNLNVVLKSLESTAANERGAWANGNLTPEEYEQLQSAIKELTELEKVLAPDADIWHDDIVAVGASAIMDMLNALTYDTYGRLARVWQSTTISNKVPLTAYIDAVRQQHDFMDGMTDTTLEYGWDLLTDLWHENEASGSNNPDGSFKKSTTYCGAPSCSNCDGTECRPC